MLLPEWKCWRITSDLKILIWIHKIYMIKHKNLDNFELSQITQIKMVTGGIKWCSDICQCEDEVQSMKWSKQYILPVYLQLGHEISPESFLHEVPTLKKNCIFIITQFRSWNIQNFKVCNIRSKNILRNCTAIMLLKQKTRNVF